MHETDTYSPFGFETISDWLTMSITFELPHLFMWNFVWTDDWPVNCTKPLRHERNLRLTFPNQQKCLIWTSRSTLWKVASTSSEPSCQNSNPTIPTMRNPPTTTIIHLHPTKILHQATTIETFHMHQPKTIKATKRTQTKGATMAPLNQPKHANPIPTVPLTLWDSWATMRTRVSLNFVIQSLHSLYTKNTSAILWHCHQEAL